MEYDLTDDIVERVLDSDTLKDIIKGVARDELGMYQIANAIIHLVHEEEAILINKIKEDISGAV